MTEELGQEHLPWEVCVAKLSNLPTTNNKQPWSHCLVHNPLSVMRLGLCTPSEENNQKLPSEAEKWNVLIPGEKDFQFQHQISKIPVCSVLTFINGQILLEHSVVSSLEKLSGGNKGHSWVKLPSPTNACLWDLNHPALLEAA